MKKLLLFLFVMVVCSSAIAETININWKVDGTNYSQSTCQTGSDLILPATAPTKYGYEFRGWEVNSLITGTVKTGSKNLFDVANSGIATVGTLQSDGSYRIPRASSIGIWTPNNKVIFNGEENTRYTLSAEIKSSNVYSDISLGWFYSDGTIQMGSPRGLFSDYTKVTAISEAGKTVTGFGAFYASGEDIYLKDIQIEKGTTATAYEPYNALSIPSPTNPVEPEFYTAGNIVLRALGNGEGAVADTYDLATGKITRRVGVKVFNGTESFNESSANDYRWNSSEYATKAPVATVLCSHLPFSTDSGNGASIRGMASENISFRNIPSAGINVNAIGSWRQWLANQYAAGTPVTVYYPLATPTEETPN